MIVMWFGLGVLCGVAVGLALSRGKRRPDGKKADGVHCLPSKQWGETRNFLYYDGTVMPEIKEDLNEQ